MTTTIRHCRKQRRKPSSTQQPRTRENGRSKRVIFDLWELIAKFEKRISIRALQNGFFYDVSMDQASPRFCWGHPRILSDMIGALADHLFLHILKGSLVVIQLQTVPLDKPGKFILKFLIMDNSLHLSSESLEPIFSRFTKTVLSISNDPTQGRHWVCRLAPPLVGKLSIQNFPGWGNRYTIETELTTAK
ncbi:MAG: hypothetical protein ABFS18_01790 [Thermodesulfobacteriota bacterium]